MTVPHMTESVQLATLSRGQSFSMCELRILGVVYRYHENK